MAGKNAFAITLASLKYSITSVIILDDHWRALMHVRYFRNEELVVNGIDKVKLYRDILYILC